jgi:hypothetical protein
MLAAMQPAVALWRAAPDFGGLCYALPTVLWRGNGRIAGSYVSVRRQEPTPKGGGALSIAITQSPTGWIGI